MALTKIVNGVEVTLSPEEETSVLAEWAAKDPEAPDNLKAYKLKRIKRLYKSKKKLLDDMEERQILLAKALKILAQYVTITDPTDQADLVALRNKFIESIDLEAYARQLESAVDADPVNTDVELGWPV